jgi:hypothetical protein
MSKEQHGIFTERGTAKIRSGFSRLNGGYFKCRRIPSKKVT